MSKILFALSYAMYYFLARHLPGSDVPYSLGSKKIRAFCCRRIFKSFGKNVNIAIEDGLRVLGLEREDVDIKILETGGLFKKAKVCLMYEEKQEV